MGLLLLLSILIVYFEHLTRVGLASHTFIERTTYNSLLSLSAFRAYKLQIAKYFAY